MAKAPNGLTGKVSGKVGKTVLSSWNGIEILKAAPVRTAPPTENEKKQRNIFGKQSWAWMNPIKPFLKQGFQNYSRTNKGLTAARSYLLKEALVKQEEDSYFDPSKMLVSYGDLPQAEDAAVELDSGHRLVFTWNTALEPGARSLDQAMLMAYNIEEKSAIYTLGGDFRKAGTASLDLSQLKNGAVHIYLAFVAADGSRQSDSLYLGTVEKGA